MKEKKEIEIPWGAIFFLLLIALIGLVSNDSFWAAIGGDPNDCITRRCSERKEADR
jgi:hypothetical protein